MSRHRLLAVPMEEIPFVILSERLRPPFDWADLFGRGGPVELEIGSGKGKYLIEASKLRPESNFLGVERAGKWFRRSVERVYRADRPNLRLIQADALDLLTRWIPPGSLAAVHVYFPDPWPKKRHARRRLLKEPLYSLAARALGPERPLLIASDVEPYFVEAVETIERGGLFRSVPWPPDAPDRLPTNYAAKYEREGRSLHYAKFLRLARAAGPRGVEAGPTACFTLEA